MSSLFSGQQLDYVFFFYGLAFLLLAAICAVMHQTSVRRLPWGWLGLFGLLHGINEWLDMAALSFPDNIVFTVVRLLFMATSFACLLEFGRAGLSALGEKALGRWIYLPLLACAACGGGFDGASGLNAVTRYAFGLIGGLWTAWTLVCDSRQEVTVRRPLLVAALGMACYALATGFVVPQTSFFPASVVNQASFLAWTGIPIQFVRGCLAILITAAIWQYQQRLCKQDVFAEIGRESKSPYGFQLAISILTILVIGKVFVEWAGYSAEQTDRSHIVMMARTAAAGVNPGRVLNLTPVASNVNHPDYIRLCEQLAQMRAVDVEIRGLYLMRQHGQDFVCVAASATDGYVGHVDMSTALRERSKELRSVFTTCQAPPVGEYRYKSGSVLCGFAPIVEPTTGQTVAVLEIDVDAVKWHRSQSRYRLVLIGMVLLTAITAIVFFVARQRIWERAERLAISEHRLADAQHTAQIGSWTYDLQTNRITWSEEMFQIHGRDPKLGAPSFTATQDFFSPGEWAKLQEALDNAIHTGTGCELEFSITRPDGDVRQIIAKARAKRGANGDVLQLVGTTQDITDRKRAASALRVSQTKYETLYDSSADAIMLLTPEEGFISGNPATMALFRFRDEQDFTSHTPVSLSPEYQPDGVPSSTKAQEMMAIAIQKGSHFFEWKHRRTDGSEFPATVLLTRISSSKFGYVWRCAVSRS